MIKESYDITVKNVNIFGTDIQIWKITRKHGDGWNLWIDGKFRTPGRKYLTGATLDEATKNIIRPSEYSHKEITSISQN